MIEAAVRWNRLGWAAVLANISSWHCCSHELLWHSASRYRHDHIPSKLHADACRVWICPSIRPMQQSMPSNDPLPTIPQRRWCDATLDDKRLTAFLSQFCKAIKQLYTIQHMHPIALDSQTVLQEKDIWSFTRRRIFKKIPCTPGFWVNIATSCIDKRLARVPLSSKIRVNSCNWESLCNSLTRSHAFFVKYSKLTPVERGESVANRWRGVSRKMACMSSAGVVKHPKTALRTQCPGYLLKKKRTCEKPGIEWASKKPVEHLHPLFLSTPDTSVTGEWLESNSHQSLIILTSFFDSMMAFVTGIKQCTLGTVFLSGQFLWQFDPPGLPTTSTKEL